MRVIREAKDKITASKQQIKPAKKSIVLLREPDKAAKKTLDVILTPNNVTPTSRALTNIHPNPTLTHKNLRRLRWQSSYVKGHRQDLRSMEFLR